MNSDNQRSTYTVLSDCRLSANANFPSSIFYLYLNEKHIGWTQLHLFPPPPKPFFFFLNHTQQNRTSFSQHSEHFCFFFPSLCCCSKLCCFLPGLLEKGHRIEGNYIEKCRHLSVLVVWDLKWSCWQFSFTVGHCGAGRFCSEPQSWAWRLRVLPYVGPHRCQQQMCWTTRLRPWTPCLGRGCVHGLLAGVKKYAVNKKKTTKKLRIKV